MPRTTKISPFINKYNRPGTNFSSERKKFGKRLRKIIEQVLLMICMLNIYIYICISICFNDSKGKRVTSSCSKKLSAS